MKKLSREAEALFHDALHEDDPTEADQARVFENLRASIAVAAAAAAAGESSAVAGTGLQTGTEAGSGAAVGEVAGRGADVGVGTATGTGAGAGSGGTAGVAMGSVSSRLGALLLNKTAGLLLATGVVAGGMAMIEPHLGHHRERAPISAEERTGHAPAAPASSIAWSEPNALPRTQPDSLPPTGASPGPAEPTPLSTSASPGPAEPTPLPAGVSTAVERSGMPPSLAAETLILEQAQGALRSGQPGRALPLLDEYAARFPHGSLREEAAVARILALCAAKRDTSARLELARFHRRWPGSLLSARLAKSCAAEGTPFRGP